MYTLNGPRTLFSHLIASHRIENSNMQRDVSKYEYEYENLFIQELYKITNKQARGLILASFIAANLELKQSNFQWERNSCVYTKWS